MQTIKQSILSIAIGLALVAGISYADWRGAQGNPPALNAPAPINVSLNPQIFGDPNLNTAQNKTLSIGNSTNGTLGLNGSMSVGGSIGVSGVSVFKGGKNKDDFTSFFPNNDGKNYIRGTTIIADGAIRSGVTARLDNDNLGNNLYDRKNNRVGIGTSNPQAKLDINTNDGTKNEWALKIVDGSQGNGKVLTSDADGLATWAELPPPTVNSFGGMYSTITNGVCNQGNVFTGICSCPLSYTPALVVISNAKEEKNNKYVYYCYFK